MYIPACECNRPHICLCLQETHSGTTSLRTTKALSLTNGQQLDCPYPCSFSYRDPLYISSMTLLTGGPSIYRHPYFDVYHRYFQRFRGANVTFLEIGIQV